MEEQNQQQLAHPLEKPKKKFNKKWWLIILFGVIIIGAGYYWFGYRVTEIRKECNLDAKMGAIKLKNPNASGLTTILGDNYRQEDYDRIYQTCLNLKSENDELKNEINVMDKEWNKISIMVDLESKVGSEMGKIETEREDRRSEKMLLLKVNS